MTRPPNFDADGIDPITYHPWWLQDHGSSSSGGQPRYVLGLGVKWTETLPSVDAEGYYVAGLSPGFYLNGPGLEGVAVAALHKHRIDAVRWTDSESDACLLGMETLAEAAHAATVLSDTFQDPPAFHRMVLHARANGLEHG